MKSLLCPLLCTLTACFDDLPCQTSGHMAAIRNAPTGSPVFWLIAPQHQTCMTTMAADSWSHSPALCLRPNYLCVPQSSHQAQTLLDHVGFFPLSHTLLLYGQGEAVVMVMMRFVEAAAALGEPFFR